MQRNGRAGILVALALGLAACGKSNAGDGEAEAEKKAFEAAAGTLKQPVALIAAYLPHARFPEGGDKYVPQRHADLDKSTLCAANEIRYAANKARQALEVSSANATKDLQGAFKGVTEACADAAEPGALAKCGDAVKALDASIEKTAAAAAAMGVTAKYPRVTPEAITDEAKASIAPFLKAKGPGANEKTYAEKRSDPKATVGDVIAACQAADDDGADAMRAFEKAEESIRLIAVTRKLALDSQCRRLGEIQNLSNDVGGCRKKTKSTECKVVCAKAKNALEGGLPAAAFEPLEKDYADICGKI